MPGTHGPGPVGRLLPPVMGSIVELERAGTTLSRFYITGDTPYRPALREITERFPELDGMIIHLGGTGVLSILVTMDHRQGADLVELIAPPITIPIHYDDFTVFRSPLADFIAEVRQRRLPGQLRTIQRGQTMQVPSRERR